MVIIIIYLFSFVIAILSLLVCLITGNVEPWMKENIVIIGCGISGGLGGAVYCLRGIYVNYSAKKNWDKAWYPWYFIRPVVSIITGGISFVFLKAGLLVLEAQKDAAHTNNWGFYALAFIAGLNVDKFLVKIEELAKTTWGIDKPGQPKKDDTKPDDTPTPPTE